MSVYPPCPEGHTQVYALIDPRTDQTRYIGVSWRVRRRLSQHMKCDDWNRHKNHWIAQLKASGLRPRLEILETVSLDIWCERERFWIAHYRVAGAPLVNQSDGGDSPTATPAVAARVSAALRGRKHSPERVQAMKDGKRGWKPSPEQSKKISDAHKRDAEKTRVRCLKAAWARHHHEKPPEHLFAPDLPASMIALYRTGKTCQQVANVFGVHYLTVARHVNKAGAMRSKSEFMRAALKDCDRRIQISDEQKKQIRFLYLSGMPARQVAIAVGLTEWPIQRFLREEGIMRTKSEATRQRYHDERQQRLDL